MKRRRKGRTGAIAAIVGGCALLALCVLLRLFFTGSAPENPPAAETPPPGTAAPTAEPTPAPTPEPTTEPTPTPGPLVVIDPGHQLHGDYAPEPLGPGSAETKACVTDGTQGVVTGVPEYELNLALSLLLREELEARGWRVVMTRETNDVSLSNMERAAIANELGADVFVRIHANAGEDPAARGIMTICLTAQNPFHPELYERSRALAERVLAALGDAVGCEPGLRSLWETDTMSGINHAQMPTVIVETGFMSNPDEDRLLADPDYRALVAAGIAEGLAAWYAAG
ncbi:MAG: N-acetylmuramoyl-L-alanine amidase [Oscillospiraceae bacterium]|nr:N-acetylmuramoyl-L-alanine amidase [Oscillospiraceae bacterium]